MISIIASSAPGLSPLARGTLTRRGIRPAPRRFIPAGAGNTEIADSNKMEFSVYPRWRGEHPHYAGIVREKSGLSPLARGTRRLRAALFLCLRFIPAGAGNTAADSRADHHRPVYPRWRGEHIFRHITKRWGIGLSPLARGTLQNKTVLIAFCRFIPAGAGNTKWQFWPLLIMAVYPRWRGEHVS
ncbi:Domain of uncharacterised function (DUF2825) [Escherichia coli]|nr:Domain of uncharacterised function (DUF2825) [Escherichia coli]